MCHFPCIWYSIHISIKRGFSYRSTCWISAYLILCINISSFVCSCLSYNSCIYSITIWICCSCLCKHRLITILCSNNRNTVKAFCAVRFICHLCLVWTLCHSGHLFTKSIVCTYCIITLHVVSINIETTWFSFLTHINNLVFNLFSCTNA